MSDTTVHYRNPENGLWLKYTECGKRAAGRLTTHRPEEATCPDCVGRIARRAARKAGA